VVESRIWLRRKRKEEKRFSFFLNKKGRKDFGRTEKPGCDPVKKGKKKKEYLIEFSMVEKGKGWTVNFHDHWREILGRNRGGGGEISETTSRKGRANSFLRTFGDQKKRRSSIIL